MKYHVIFRGFLTGGPWTPSGVVEDNSGVHEVSMRFLKSPKNNFVSNYSMNQNRVLRQKMLL